LANADGTLNRSSLITDPESLILESLILESLILESLILESLILNLIVES
jgi:hypothetical protein